MNSQVFSLVISIGQSTGQVRKASHQDQPEFEPGDDKEYEVEAIRDSAVYTKEVDGHLPEL